MIPTRYPGISPTDEPAVQLARKTEWMQIESTSLDRGVGQRALATDSSDYGILDLREVEFDFGVDELRSASSSVSQETDENEV